MSLTKGPSWLYYSCVNKRASRVREAPAAADDTMFLLMHAAGTIERRLEDALGTVGLSLAKFGALTFLVHAGAPLSLSECAAKMTCVRSNITQLVDRLESEGLVRRVDNPSDRRGVMAAPTPLGIERQAAGAKLVDEVKRQFAKTLSGIDRDELARALIAIK
jgi:DNA-binding MarR family transcriptional regulator